MRGGRHRSPVTIEPCSAASYARRQRSRTGRSDRERFESIQYLRAFAALAVVFHHARNPHSWLYPGLAGVGLGQSGVDLFFVISGFIMYVAARKLSVNEFVGRRLVRIVPLYWVATLLFVLLTVASRHSSTSPNCVSPCFSSRVTVYGFHPLSSRSWFRDGP